MIVVHLYLKLITINLYNIGIQTIEIIIIHNPDIISLITIIQSEYKQALNYAV